MKNQPFLRKLNNAAAGIAYVWRSEDNLRRHVLSAAAALLLFLLLQPGWVWWGLVVLCVGQILAAEMLNSALEELIDHVHPDRHSTIRRVKDALAGMVLILSVAAAAVGILAVVDTLDLAAADVLAK